MDPVQASFFLVLTISNHSFCRCFGTAHVRTSCPPTNVRNRPLTPGCRLSQKKSAFWYFVIQALLTVSDVQLGNFNFWIKKSGHYKYYFFKNKLNIFPIFFWYLHFFIKKKLIKTHASVHSSISCVSIEICVLCVGSFEKVSVVTGVKNYIQFIQTRNFKPTFEL